MNILYNFGINLQKLKYWNILKSEIKTNFAKLFKNFSLRTFKLKSPYLDPQISAIHTNRRLRYTHYRRAYDKAKSNIPRYADKRLPLIGEHLPDIEKDYTVQVVVDKIRDRLIALIKRIKVLNKFRDDIDLYIKKVINAVNSNRPFNPQMAFTITTNGHFPIVKVVPKQTKKIIWNGTLDRSFVKVGKASSIMSCLKLGVGCVTIQNSQVFINRNLWEVELKVYIETMGKPMPWKFGTTLSYDIWKENYMKLHCQLV